MKFVDSVKQDHMGVGGILETWVLNNALYISFWRELDGRNPDRYEISINNVNDQLFTKCIYNILSNKYNDLPMNFVELLSCFIIIEHEYFYKFIFIVEKLNVNDLTPDTIEV